MASDTIAAIATPIGRGGIGIIRISGPEALRIAGALFIPKGKGAAAGDGPGLPQGWTSHRLYLGSVTDPDSGRLLDEVLVAVMKAPHSYTREDVVEIQAHSGRVVLHTILKAVIRHGARLAEPGEFTLRAFLNGRIDLTQAEAVADVIQARTEKALGLATAQLEGVLGETVASLRQVLLDALRDLEAGIDFPEDVGEEIDFQHSADRIEAAVLRPLEILRQDYREGRYFRDGIRMALVGRTNVGKSSIMNRLLQKERVIVAETHGTTRDAVDDILNIKGVPVTVTDTAGLRDTRDAVEQIGVAHTRRILEEAELVLFIIDAGQGLQDDEKEILAALNGRPVVLVANKVDLLGSGARVSVPDATPGCPAVETSALCNIGMEALKERIVELATGGSGVAPQNGLVPNLRHHTAIGVARDALVSVLAGLRSGESPELVAIPLKEAIDALGSILGLVSREDTLDAIFQRFCIGK